MSTAAAHFVGEHRTTGGSDEVSSGSTKTFSRKTSQDCVNGEDDDDDDDEGFCIFKVPDDKWMSPDLPVEAGQRVDGGSTTRRGSVMSVDSGMSGAGSHTRRGSAMSGDTGGGGESRAVGRGGGSPGLSAKQQTRDVGGGVGGLPKSQHRDDVT